MKKLVIVLLTLCVSVSTVIGCNKKNKSSHMNTTEGKVVDEDDRKHEPIRGYSIQKDDTISLQFWDSTEKKDGMDLVKCDYVSVRGKGFAKSIDDSQYKYDYAAARHIVEDYLKDKEIAESADLILEDGSMLYLEYDNIKTIEKLNYYIINVVKEDKDKNVVYRRKYAVSVDEGTLFMADGEDELILKKQNKKI